MSRNILTLSDFEQTNWHELVSKNFDLQTGYLYDIFWKEAKKNNDTKNECVERVFVFLGEICSLVLNKHRQPGKFTFSAFKNGKTQRSISIEDFSDEELIVLLDIALITPNVFLKAQMYDILCERRLGQFHKNAVSAIESYLEAAKSVKDSQFKIFYCERAIDFAMKISKGKPYFKEVVKNIISIQENTLRLDFVHFAEILFPHLKNEEQLAQTLKMEQIGNDLTKSLHLNDVRNAIKIWNILIALSKQRFEKCKYLKLLAETYIILAEFQNYPGVQASFIEKAIKYYREIPNSKIEIANLRAKLCNIQSQIPNTLQQFKLNINNLEIINEIKTSFQGLEIREALMQLCFGELMLQPFSRENILIEIEETIAKYPFLFMLDTKYINQDGKTIAKQEGYLKKPEHAIQSETARRLRFSRIYFVIHNVKPALEQICLDNQLMERREILSFEYILNNNLYANPSQIGIINQGLMAGLYGDYCIGTHLLLPVIESSLRHILKRVDIETTGLDKAGIQLEKSLNQLLEEEPYKSKLIEIIGYDWVFDFTDLLISHIGENMRNKVLHGLVGDSYFEDKAVIYFWWLCLRFYLEGNIKANNA